ncbi:FIG002343: hypothetical protein [hydrothermal vent metagenome]|uniref:Uncharacterized protein n=1 Tax=hydrothermal vent metagenome TaxID=652676 RepID=A0A3B1BP36_9ZZZZ
MRTRSFIDYFQLGRFFHGDEPVAGAISLGRRNIYILPTRDGLFFAVILILMLIGSINYNNSLGYLLCFLLGSLTIVSILHTYKNLYRLEISMGEIKPVFCQQMLHIPLMIKNLHGPVRLALEFKVAHGDTLAIHDIPANTSSDITLKYKAHQRGRLKLPSLRISSRFPLGLFQTWSILNFSRTLLVYPQPANDGQPTSEQPRPGDDKSKPGAGDEDFNGLRNYLPGDPLRHIHWKALAKKQGVLTKQFGAEAQPELWFDWRSLAPLDTEARLSQLTRWIIEAQKNDLAYGLWIPDAEVAPTKSHLHQHRCLRLLAEFRQTEFILSESAPHE